MANDRDKSVEAEQLRLQVEEQWRALDAQEISVKRNFDISATTESNLVRALTLGHGGLIIFTVQIANVGGRILPSLSWVILIAGFGLGLMIAYELFNWGNKSVVYHNTVSKEKRKNRWIWARLWALAGSTLLLVIGGIVAAFATFDLANTPNTPVAIEAPVGQSTTSTVDVVEGAESENAPEADDQVDDEENSAETEDGTSRDINPKNFSPD